MGSGPQMRLLLDTHIWLWSMAEPSRIIRRVSRELEDPENEIWLSPVSTWELLVLARKRRIELDTEPVTWIRTALAEVSFKEAALTHEVAVQIHVTGSDRKSTRLNSSHLGISYAVFCLKKKKKEYKND